MSYTFSSATLPIGFSIVGTQLIAAANAPAFNGVITIVLTDGLTTVNKTISINRRSMTIAPLVAQSIELVSAIGLVTRFEVVSVIVTTTTAASGSNDSFVLLPTASTISIAGPNDSFVPGVSTFPNGIIANGVSFNFAYLDHYSNVVTSFSAAEFVKVFRPYEDSTATNEASIGCTIASAASFRTSLLDATRLRLGQSGITAGFCSVGTDTVGGPSIIKYLYYTNNRVGGS